MIFFTDEALSIEIVIINLSNVIDTAIIKFD